ncbi:hypothetical protein Y032_0009g822 [Ancylostoma ceylanicum]|uniref:Uncharacterized protein n=1 Tax=Ancylostoma ceylanicum TaxID=53326 RepID=A0A016VLJ0_9BILA|nr:hypothetical protein Y032_0009g822 [Ancylostoma ceylanicum]
MKNRNMNGHKKSKFAVSRSLSFTLLSLSYLLVLQAFFREFMKKRSDDTELLIYARHSPAQYYPDGESTVHEKIGGLPFGGKGVPVAVALPSAASDFFSADFFIDCT